MTNEENTHVLNRWYNVHLFTGLARVTTFVINTTQSKENISTDISVFGWMNQACTQMLNTKFLSLYIQIIVKETGFSLISFFGDNSGGFYCDIPIFCQLSTISHLLLQWTLDLQMA